MASEDLQSTSRALPSLNISSISPNKEHTHQAPQAFSSTVPCCGILASKQGCRSNSSPTKSTLALSDFSAEVLDLFRTIPRL